MISGANQQAIEAAGLPFILGMRIPRIPHVVAHWRREHPGEEIPRQAGIHSALADGAVRGRVTRSSTTSTGAGWDQRWQLVSDHAARDQLAEQDFAPIDNC